MGKTLQQILKDPDRKSLSKIGVDLTRLYLKYKSRKKIGFYDTQLMYKKDDGKLKDYLPPQIFRKFTRQNSNRWGDSGLNDKLEFHDLMKKTTFLHQNILERFKMDAFMMKTIKKFL